MDAVPLDLHKKIKNWDMIIIQLTGLSGSGKTTLANAMKLQLSLLEYEIEILDGDELRKTVSRDLGFSRADRIENNLRIGKLALEKWKEGKLVIVSTINPYEESRAFLKSQSPLVYTIWIHASIKSLLLRDTKGLYKKALHPPDGSPAINLSGINDPYEIPENPDLIISTDSETESESILQLKEFILSKLKRTS